MARKDTPERKEIPSQYRWKTAHLFKSDAAWERERKSLVASLSGIAEHRGKLKQGRRRVLTCIQRYFEAHRRLSRLINYAHRLYDQDTRVPRYQGFKAVIEKVATDFAEISSFLQPELLSLPAATLRALIKDPAFAEYGMYLQDILRNKPHILSQREEALLASASQMRDTGHEVYSTFTGADIRFPEIEDERGRRVRLTQSLFARYRSSPDRKVRKAAFSAFFGTYHGYRNTLASLLSAQVNANITYARARNYGSALEAALDANNIPTSVYRNMIKAVNRYLPLLHRYLKLRRKLLGLRQLRYHDMYPPMMERASLKYSYDEARELLVSSLAPMGQEYVEVLAAGLNPRKGWVDPFPNKGKRSGAYMDGSAYDVHPYVLANFIGDYGSVSTIAHEMGHAMHSYLSNDNQPYGKSGYSIFVAEVASTFNEALLMEHLLGQVKQPRKRLYLLGEQLESFRQTLFRQSMFAEFELAVYERGERKLALTAEDISRIYLGICRRYYGHQRKVVLVDEQYGIEWAYVPHFYYNFYVYQYVTGITAATALAELVLKRGAPARDRYLEHLLKAGGSDYPIQLLERAGVDLTTTRPYDMAMGVFERTLLEAEKLVASLR
jgi:oligoendopeptidase F